METTSDKYAEYEYETQFFGFTPESFVDGVYNAVNDYTTDCFQELETLLKNELATSGDLTAEEIHEACVKMTNNFYKTVDGAFDRFEMYVKKNIFRIPPHVLLPEDKVHRDHQFTEKDQRKINKELEELHRKIKAAKYVNAALKQENKDLDNAQERVDDFEKQLDAMKKISMDVGSGLFDQAKKVHDLLRDGLQSGAFEVQTPSVCEDFPQKTKDKKIKIG